jgi:hypothetical protein
VVDLRETLTSSVSVTRIQQYESGKRTFCVHLTLGGSCG